MKRSRAIRLVLLGTTGLVALTACDQPDPTAAGNFYRDQQQCERANDADACRMALADARAQHLQTAPAFTSRQDCEAQFGAENCMETKERPGQAPADSQQASMMGGSWFMPLMMGYMLGQTMGRFSGQPVYRDTTNTAYSGNRTVGRINDRVSPPPRPPGDAVARGGFGRSATGTSSAT
jgi:uncharacterized protein YgiB involved in biofilm formation